MCCLSPHVIIGAFGFRCVLRSILFEHTLEDGHITGRYVDELEAYIECIRVNMVSMAPLTARNKDHGILVGNFGRKLDV